MKTAILSLPESCASRARKLVSVATFITVDFLVIADFRATTALPVAAILVGTVAFTVAISVDTVATSAGTNQPYNTIYLQELGDVRLCVVKLFRTGNSFVDLVNGLHQH